MTTSNTLTPAGHAHADACDAYLGARTGRFEWRAVRYRAAMTHMVATAGLTDQDTLLDLAAGWTELDAVLRVDAQWRGRYVPVDGGIDGVDLERWRPTRPVDWVIGLEIIEHLHSWPALVTAAQHVARKGVILSTPNPQTTDVLGMDSTHVVEVHADQLEHLGFTVHPASFYGQRDDSLFATWAP